MRYSTRNPHSQAARTVKGVDCVETLAPAWLSINEPLCVETQHVKLLPTQGDLFPFASLRFKYSGTGGWSMIAFCLGWMDKRYSLKWSPAGTVGECPKLW